MHEVGSRNKNLSVIKKNHHPQKNKNLPARVLGGKNPDSFESKGVIILCPKLRIKIDPGMTPTKSLVMYAELIVSHFALAVVPVNQALSLLNVGKKPKLCESTITTLWQQINPNKSAITSGIKSTQL